MLSEATPLSTAIPVYEDRPTRRAPRGYLAPLLLGTVLVAGSLGLLAAAPPAPATALHAARLSGARLPVTRLAAGPDEDLTVGDLLRGGRAKKGAAAVTSATSAIADKLRRDILEEEEAATAPVVPKYAGLLPPSPWQNAKALVVDEEKGITRTSFGLIGLSSGLVLLVYGFGAYFQLLPGESFSAIMLIYGFPATLIGFALKYAELKPLVCRSTPEAVALRAAQATDIQKQVREDVTRYRYGDEKHLDEALSRVFQLGRPGGVPRNAAPTLVGIQEQVVDGQYALVLEFENNPRVELKQWVERQPKFQAFFGPGIRAELSQSAVGVDVALVCDGSGAGRTGKVQGEALPPLMPGLPARRQD